MFLFPIADSDDDSLRDIIFFIAELNVVTSSSPWDHVSPSPIPIRASGSSVKSSVSGYNRRTHKPAFSSETSNRYEVYFAPNV